MGGRRHCPLVLSRCGQEIAFGLRHVPDDSQNREAKFELLFELNGADVDLR